MHPLDLMRGCLVSAGRSFERLGRAFIYPMAGTMRLSDLRLGIERAWTTFNITEAEILAGWMPWERRLADEFVRSGDAVLIVGSGSGRDVLAFLEMGCRVTAIEPVSALVTRARSIVGQRGMTADFVEGYIEDVTLAGQFDVISFSYFCYSYIPGSLRRVAALEKAAAHLAPGGRMFISYVAGERSPCGALLKLGRLVGSWCRSDWRLECGDSLSTVGTWPPALTYEHVFSFDEVVREAAQAGLRVHARGRFSAEPFVVLMRT